jgi:RNA polymerase sigma factor (sigma-70 family)
MASKNLNLSLVENLEDVSRKKGFLSFEDILKTTSAAAITADDLDRICEALQLRGVLIDEDEKEKPRLEIANASHGARFQKDLAILERVIRIDEGLVHLAGRLRSLWSMPQFSDKALLLQMRAGNLFARNCLLAKYFGSVLRRALWAYRNYSIPIADSIQNGFCGLLIAVNRIEKKQVLNLAGYCQLWIMRYIQTADITVSPYFTIPLNVKTTLMRIRRIEKVHDCALCNGADICEGLLAELSSYLGLSRFRAWKFLSLTNGRVFPELRKDGEMIEGEFSDNGRFIEKVTNRVRDESVKSIVLKSLECLKERERVVIMWRFGIEEREAMTLDQIGAILGLTREGVRQIEVRALSKLRKRHSELRESLAVYDFQES